MKLVSGGQTGVDQAALDAALDLGWPCGGWCPAGRRSEAGVIPARYPLTEHASAAWADRTRANVRDTDGTLVVHVGPPTGGTALTVEAARTQGRPLLLLAAGERSPAQAVEALVDFLERHRIRVLNVAGPRASEAPEAGAWTRELFLALAEADRESGRNRLQQR